MREDRLVRCLAARRAAREQRRVEPPAVLVGAFEIKVDLVALLTSLSSATAAHDTPDSNHTSTMSCWVSHLVPPHEQVGAGEGMSSAAGFENQLVRTFPREHVGHVLHDGGIEQILPAVGAAERGDGHAPHALTREAPIGRASIMPRMRFSPHDGIHCVFPISTRASVTAAIFRHRPRRGARTTARSRGR